jgi:hypothetical protein
MDGAVNTVPYISRDYYWKRVGLRWEVWTAYGDEHSRVGDFSFWRWGTAARVSNKIFEAYHTGRDAERGRKS